MARLPVIESGGVDLVVVGRCGGAVTEVTALHIGAEESMA